MRQRQNRQGTNGSVYPPRKPSQMGKNVEYDGWWGATPPPAQIPEWQKTGYRMEDAACDDAEVIDDRNDCGYLPTDHYGMPSPGLDVDGMSATGVDKRLEDQRSRTVKEHLGQFWSKVNPKVKNGADDKRRAMGETEESMPERADELGPAPTTGSMVSGPMPPANTHPGSRVMIYVILSLCVVVAVAVLIATELFRITDIRVTGNHRISAEEIIRISGIKRGGNVLALNEKQIDAAISGNRYLKLVLLEHDNHTVTLQVFEREPAAYTVVRGIYYTLDRRGMVLEEYADASGLADHLVLVDKLNVHSCIVGKHLSLYDSDCMDAFLQLMLEFHAMDIGGEIAVLYLDDLDNICLSTRSGYYVRLGDATYLHGKLRSMLLTIDALMERDYHGGTVDVSVRDKPTYSPEMGGISYSGI